MAIPSTQISNACIYTTYGVFLVFGLLVAWKFSNRKEFLAAIRSQPAIPLAFNFIASGWTVTRDSVCALQFFRIVLLLWSTILSGILFLFLRAHVLNDVNSMFSRRKYIHGQLPIIRNEHGPVRRVFV
ncbi:hypothetical protein V1520DRAFT_271044 [Lipomyces starkeyi]|uniref:Uncharacterized protein n=1 Tax=Lipomyces starkeyi NRRL Y-11557 TaxID=675824 RepID=A0A1E3Q5T9_LIPST|nr:hypothetical protein LIPSTDRAFT_63364 [Lipomyces starkeyi NRRL Y-11557]